MLVSWTNFRAVILSGAVDQEPEVLAGLPLSGPVDVLFLVGFPPGQIGPKDLAGILPRALVVGGKDAAGAVAGESAWLDYPILPYDTLGWIDIVTDGQKMWVEVEKTSGK